jgi:hypothetical protein
MRHTVGVLMRVYKRIQPVLLAAPLKKDRRESCHRLASLRRSPGTVPQTAREPALTCAVVASLADFGTHSAQEPVAESRAGLSTAAPSWRLPPVRPTA